MRRHGWALVLAAALGGGLLVLLGVLQVRWLDQVAQTIAAQKRAGLSRQGAAIATDLEREFTRAWLWFRLEGDLDAVGTLAKRWQSWREASPHPELLATVWLIDRGGEEAPRLRRLGPAGVAEDAPWPPVLAPLRDTAGERPRFAGLLPFRSAAAAWLSPPTEPGLDSDETRFTVLLEIDVRRLAENWLPARTAAHREPDGATVVARLEDGITGDALFPGPPVRAGEHPEILLMGLRPDLISDDLLAGMQPPQRGPREFEPPRRLRFGAGMPIGIPPGAGTGWGGGGSRPGHPGPALIRRGFFGGPPGGHLGPPGHWRLALAYAAGPVDDVVTSLRRRNLTLGMSALALLGGAIAALVLAVRRAHALAEQRRQFMASISHELRTPLAVIGAAAENLRDGTIEDAARVREYGGLIHTESQRLGTMMEHSLRLAAGQDLADEANLRPVDVRAVVDVAVASFAAEVTARGGRIDRDQPPAPTLATANAEALRQAVENVVGNAIKYGGDPPRVTVRVCRLEVPSGPRVQIIVEDHGLGIPRDEIDRVFEPFFRGREVLARQIRGTGLGLALVARVMRAHRGGVAVHSPPGGGSVFVLWLPAGAGA